VVAKLVDHCQGEEAQSSNGDSPRMSVSFSDDGHALVSICPEAKNIRCVSLHSICFVTV
jgi:hypothetical protein